jgi:hypothetical protein
MLFAHVSLKKSSTGAGFPFPCTNALKSTPKETISSVASLIEVMYATLFVWSIAHPTTNVRLPVVISKRKRSPRRRESLGKGQGDGDSGMQHWVSFQAIPLNVYHSAAVRALQKAGFRVIRQGKHIVMSIVPEFRPSRTRIYHGRYCPGRRSHTRIVQGISM